MQEKKSKSSQFEDLRKRAEQVLTEKEGKFSKDDIQDFSHLLNELNIHQVELELQNDELKNTQNMLEEINQKYMTLFELAPVGYFTMNKQGLIKEANLTAAELLGVNKLYLINSAFHRFIHEDYRLRFYQHMNQLYQKDMKHSTVLKMVRKNGEEFFIQLDNLTNPEDHNNGVIRTSMTDITDRIKAEENLKKANKKLETAVAEKDLMMKEVNHRVKNHLSLISSLINLKMSVSNTRDLGDLKNQIDAVRIVHEKMYIDDNISHINFGKYIQDLLDTVFGAFTEKQVRIVNKIKNYMIPTKQTVTLGLLINEIATNSIKHGFSGIQDEEPRFYVDMERDDSNNEYILNISSNGNPLPADYDPDNAKTLGLSLISALVEQSYGNLELQKEPYPKFKLRFPVETVEKTYNK
jgi:PAS domain S-box-containing protein